MKFESSCRNGTSLAQANASILHAAARVERFAQRAGQIPGFCSRVLESAQTVHRRRGPGYFGYLLRGWLFPRIQYRVLFCSSPRTDSVLRMILPGCIVASSALLLGIYGALASALIYGSMKLFGRAMRISEKRRLQQSLKRTFQIQKNRRSGAVAQGRVAAKETTPITTRYDREEDFLNQAISILLLSREARVPALRAIDETKRALSFDFIGGVPVNEALKNIEYETRNTIIDNIERQMNRIHALGIAGLRKTLSCLVVDSNHEPWFTEFSKVSFHRSLSSLRYRLERDRDRNAFNRLFDRSIMTEKMARIALARQKKRVGEWYAPIDFGHGLTVGHFWSTDLGTGRWDYFNARALQTLLPGKRILDLGCNTGVMDILMLRAGAKEIIGLEQSSRAVETGKIVKEIFEWKDHRHYDLSLHNKNMLSILSEDYGKFDIVSAFCSLYYLSEEDMGRVIRRAAEISRLFLLQATTQTKREDKMRKSTLEFLIELLRTNGYPNVKVVAPHSYSRPLIIARCAKQAQ